MRISFLFKKAQIENIVKSEKIENSEIIEFRNIILMFWPVFCWFLMVRWCGIYVIKQNRKYHMGPYKGI